LWWNHYIWNSSFFSIKAKSQTGQEAVPWAQELMVDFSKETTLNKISGKSKHSPPIQLIGSKCLVLELLHTHQQDVSFLLKVLRS
jgi:hypothetical protein